MKIINKSFVRHRNIAGFTLLEVLFTLSVVSISLVTLIRAFVVMAGGAATASNHTKAMYLIEQKLQDIKRQSLHAEQWEGVFDEPFQRFRWKIAKNNFSAGEFRKVDLSVSWQEAGRTRAFDAVSYIGPTENR